MAIKFRPTGKAQIGRNLRNVPLAKLPQKAVTFFKKLGGASSYAPSAVKKGMMEKFARKYQGQVTKIERNEMGLKEKDRDKLNRLAFGVGSGLTPEQEKARQQHFNYLKKIRRLESDDQREDLGDKLRENRQGGARRNVLSGSINLRRNQKNVSANQPSKPAAASAFSGAGARGVVGGGQGAVGIGGIGGQGARAMTEKGVRRFAGELVEEKKPAGTVVEKKDRPDIKLAA